MKRAVAALHAALLFQPCFFSDSYVSVHYACSAGLFSSTSLCWSSFTTECASEEVLSLRILIDVLVDHLSTLRDVTPIKFLTDSMVTGDLKSPGGDHTSAPLSLRTTTKSIGWPSFVSCFTDVWWSLQARELQAPQASASLEVLWCSAYLQSTASDAESAPSAEQESLQNKSLNLNRVSAVGYHSPHLWQDV